MLICILSLVAFSGCNQSTLTVEEETPAIQSGQDHSHDQAGETCFICDPAKREPGRLWCTEHARYEDRCWQCQPQLEDKSRLFCTEHSLYEDECFLCHPELEEGGDESVPGDERISSSASVGEAVTSTGLFCNEHNVPERECGICQPQRAAELEPGEELKIRFESSHAAGKAGLLTRTPEQTETQRNVGAVCEVRYNGNEIARITPLAPGIVRRVLVDVGTEVRAGEVLVELHSVASAEAKTAFVSASVDADLKKLTYEREEGLVAKKISPRQDLQEAEAAYKTAAFTLSMARQRLINFGLLPDEISRIENSQDCSAALLVRAPYGGTLVERAAVVGEAVEPGDALFTLANLSTMWLSLSIPGDDAKFLRSGLEVEASLSSLPDESVRGQLTWVNTSIDERSRMVQARAVVRNENRLLKSGMFGEALVLLSPKIPVLGIPAGAVQKLENRPFVFVKIADDLYGLRRVVVGHVANGFVAVTEGLRPDDQVIVEGAFTALSEFLKSRLGAGCVDD